MYITTKHKNSVYAKIINRIQAAIVGFKTKQTAL